MLTKGEIKKITERYARIDAYFRENRNGAEYGNLAEITFLARNASELLSSLREALEMLEEVYEHGLDGDIRSKPWIESLRGRLLSALRTAGYLEESPKEASDEAAE